MAETNTVQSLDRAFDLLEALCASRSGMLITELSSATGLHKSTVHRLLASMSARGYITKDEYTNQYRATTRLYELASQVVEHLDIVAAARGPMDRLLEQTGETSHLVVREGSEIVYVHKVESTQNAMRMFSRIGMRRPMYCTAVGKAMMARLPLDEVRAIWNRSVIEQYTDYTIVTLDGLLRELQEVRRVGYALDNEENELGVRCIAVAIPDYTGNICAALSTSAPVTRMDDARIEALAPLMMHTRDEIARAMGYRG